MENALEVRNISKEYKLYDSEWARLKESFNPFKKEYHKVFYALKDVSFSIKKGEKVGIIGANGAGKSTMLKIITEVLKPTSGEVIVDGRVAALLELGAGFNQDYTGIENIRLNGTLMGYKPEEIEEKQQKIIEFADIGDFINQPVKTYSSGMFVRLAFATQIFSEPDVLIVDEALSVGDIRFQQKCYRAMDSLMKDKTVVLVTHDTAAVTRFCSRVIWINKGEKVYDGEVVEGLRQYQEFLINTANENNDVADDVDNENKVQVSKEKQKVTVPEVPSNIKKMGNGKANILKCGIFNEDGKVIDVVEPKQEVDIISVAEFFETVKRPLYGVTIKDRLGNVVSCLNSEMLNVQLPKAYVGKMEYHLKFKMPPLNKGTYVISVAVANGIQMEHVQLCWIEDAIVFRVAERENDLPGFLYLDEGSIEVNAFEE